MVCSKCGANFNEGDKFCPNCGVTIEVVPKFCSSCGETLSPGVKFCVKCGASVLSEPSYMASQYSGFWLRFGALVLDNIFLSIVIIPLSIFIMSGSYGVVPNIFDITELVLLSGGGFVKWYFQFFLGSILSLYIAYFVICHSYGQTLGKKLCKIRVVKAGSLMPGFGTALLRETVGKFLSGLIFCLGYIWVGWDKDKQGWHDKIAGTFIIKV